MFDLNHAEEWTEYQYNCRKFDLYKEQLKARQQAMKAGLDVDEDVPIAEVMEPLPPPQLDVKQVMRQVDKAFSCKHSIKIQRLAKADVLIIGFQICCVSPLGTHTYQRRVDEIQA